MPTIRSSPAFKFTVLVALLTVGCSTSAGAQPSASNQAVVESERNQRQALDGILSLLKSERTGGRVYYSVDSCPQYWVPFPKVRTSKLQARRVDIAAIRAVFAGDGHVRVRENESGLIDIRIGNPDINILQTRIAFLKFGREGQYNDGIAVSEIPDTNEMRIAARRLGLSSPVRPFDYLLIPPMPGLPHLPPTMKSITADRVLDRVAKTFSGIVIYRYCRQRRLFDLDFAGGYNFDDGKPIIWDQSK